MIDPVAPPGAPSISGPFSVGGVDLAARAANVAGGDGADFGTMLAQLTANAAHVVRHAEAASIAGIQGTATVQQVVEAVMSAEQTLQGAVAIRDKVVAAYLELSRMQI
jgi:flagellar hook-basal body complex protein FliE